MWLLAPLEEWLVILAAELFSSPVICAVKPCAQPLEMVEVSVLHKLWLYAIAQIF